jgi:hypothetical protein
LVLFEKCRTKEVASMMDKLTLIQKTARGRKILQAVAASLR